MLCFESKLLWQFALESEVEETDGPAVIAADVVDEVVLVVQGMQEELVVHGWLLDGSVHEELVQEGGPVAAWVLIADAFDYFLVVLLVADGVFQELLAVDVDLFVFDFVSGHQRNLDDAICVLQLRWNTIEDLHDVFKVSFG